MMFYVGTIIDRNALVIIGSADARQKLLFYKFSFFKENRICSLKYTGVDPRMLKSSLQISLTIASTYVILNLVYKVN